ncbi:unnamed protein product [Heligmosomoides polygyrus]|uniref:Secreted protein n=1 Tax=Heligmosomoides polygyrus TaxID=6339 RepID=A0A183FPV6_HELPZ|nr:unnamed protein product [Heligmosomoides polygyrus]
MTVVVLSEVVTVLMAGETLIAKPPSRPPATATIKGLQALLIAAMKRAVAVQGCCGSSEEATGDKKSEGEKRQKES